MLTGRKQILLHSGTATMLRTLSTCIARAKNKNKNKSKNCSCRRDYITRELCCITQEIKNPTIDTAILRHEYAGCYQLPCSIMYSKEAQYLDGCLQSGFRWPRKRKRGLWHRNRHLACVASVSVGLRFFVRSKHFSVFGRAKIGASAKEVGEGAGEGRKENACPKTPRFWKTHTPTNVNQIRQVNFSVTHINTSNCFSPAGKFRCSGLTLEDGCSVASNLMDFREAFSFYMDCFLMEFWAAV